jgi:four helix bundle protein
MDSVPDVSCKVNGASIFLIAQVMKQLQNRCKTFALRAIRFCQNLPNTPESRVIRYQLLRSSTSVGANYRAACRAHTRRSFIYKLSIVEEEADESRFWLELLTDLGIGDPDERSWLMREADELTRIVAASKRTARSTT